MIHMTFVKSAAATAAILLNSSALSAEVSPPTGFGPNGFGMGPFFAAPSFGMPNPFVGRTYDGFGVSPFAPNWGGVGGSNGGFGVLTPRVISANDGLGLIAAMGWGYSLNPSTPGHRSIGRVSGDRASITAVQCTFGDELLLASSVGSCENAGGTVAPSQITYSVKCEISGVTVMTGSTAGCVRAGGDVASE